MASKLEERLAGLVSQVANVVADFQDSHDNPHAEDTTTAVHERVIDTAQVRNYLSGQVATLVRIHGAAKVEVLNAHLDLQQAETAAIKNLKTKDFESGKMQATRLMSETLDESIRYKRAQIEAALVEAALDYVREHLREFDRLGFDLTNRIKIMYSGG